MSLESQIQEKDRFIERLKIMHRQQIVEMDKALDRKHLEMVWGDNPNMAIGQAKKIGELESAIKAKDAMLRLMRGMVCLTPAQQFLYEKALAAGREG